MNKENSVEVSPDVKICTAYSSTENRGAHYLFIDNILRDVKYFRIENGTEVLCEPPEGLNKYSTTINLNDLASHYTVEIKDNATGEIVNTLDKIEELLVGEVMKLMIKSSDKNNWEKLLKPVESFSEEEQERLRKEVFPEPKEDGSSPPVLVQMDQIGRAIEDILSEQKSTIPRTFYNGINPSEGFGIERFILDRVYYLPKLLDNPQLTHLSGTHYLISSEEKDSAGNSINLEHRFQATNEEEALKLYKKISNQLAGIQQKIWLACWSLGNKLKKFTYSCQLTDLMHLTYPERNGYFSVSDKIEFYEHLKSLEQTKFVFSKPYKKGSRKRELRISYEIPLLSIPIKLSDGDRYPQQITLSMREFHPDPVNERISHVGAEIKHKTLELHADDIQLSTWLQTRKNQKQKKDFIEVDLNFLFKLAKLEKTAQSNKTHAKKLLTNKLQRLVEKKSITSFPKKLEDLVILKFE